MAKTQTQETGTHSRRWHILNRNTGLLRASKNTRNEARAAKKSNERIYDSWNSEFVR